MSSGITHGKLTAYESITTFTRNLKVYSVSDIYHVGPLIEAMREWNLHGSANNLEHWVYKMHSQMDSEWSAKPLGEIDWEEIDEFFTS